MQSRDLRRLDMTALMVFRQLMRHRQTVVVAEQLGITQSAVSHALTRLRAMFDDPLFLRRPHGLEPTLRAKALEPPIDEAITALQQIFDPPAPFDPENAGRLHMVGDEISLTTALPALITAMQTEAPGLTLTSEIMPETAIAEALENGHADAAFGNWTEVANPRLHLTWLGQQEWQVLARASHQFFAAEDRLASFRNATRITLNGLTAPGLADAPYSAPNLAAVLASLQQSSLLAVLPQRIAARFGPAMGLATAPCPEVLPDQPIAMLRHARERTNPTLHWAAARITAALR